MLTEVLENNKLKQNEDILNFHESKLKGTTSKQQEYNSILDEVTQKLQQKGSGLAQPIRPRPVVPADDELEPEPSPEEQQVNLFDAKYSFKTIILLNRHMYLRESKENFEKKNLNY